MPTLNPITRLFLQFAGGYYSLPFDGALGLVILPGTGEGLLVQGGKSYAFLARPGLAKPPAPADELAELLGAMASPVATIITPADDLSKAILSAGATGVVSLASGHYTGSYDFVVPAGV